MFTSQINQSFISLWRLMDKQQAEKGHLQPPQIWDGSVWRSYAVCFTAFLSAGIECMCIYLCMWTSWKVWWAAACRPCHQARCSGRCRAPCSRSSPSLTATACGSRSAEGWRPERCNTGGFEHFILTEDVVFSIIQKNAKKDAFRTVKIVSDRQRRFFAPSGGRL